MSWTDLFRGGGLYGQMQGEEMGGLEKLIYDLQTRGQDASMRGMWGANGSQMPRSPEAPDMWKEMLQRQMWKKKPMQRNGVNGVMPLQQQMQQRPPMPMGITGYRG